MNSTVNLYQNLKMETSLNALTDEDIKTIWLPLVVYDNTDQKEATRLGMEWEWATRVTVTREGDFTRSGIEEVDEAEIFEGSENRLTMNQTFTSGSSSASTSCSATPLTPRFQIYIDAFA